MRSSINNRSEMTLDGGPGGTLNIEKTKWFKFVAGPIAKTARVIICNMLLFLLSEVLWPPGK